MNMSGMFGRVAKGMETAEMWSNKAVNPIQGAFSAAKGANVVNRAKKISTSLATTMRTPASVSRMAGGAAIGAGAGYAFGDQDTSSTIKGAGLGLLGGAGWAASNNKMLRAGVKDAWAASKGSPGAAWNGTKNWAGNMAEKSRLNETLRNMAPHSGRY